MRLFEYQGGTIPDLRQYVTPQLVDEIIRDNHFVSHGDNLENWVGNNGIANALDGLPHDKTLQWKPFEEVRKHPDFRRAIERWLELSLKHFEECLADDFGPDMNLYRCMQVPIEWLNDPSPKMGKYWSAVPEQSERFSTFNNGQASIMMRVQAKHVMINWYETLRSRLDYDNGMDEHEFQMVVGSKIGPVEITMLDMDELVPHWHKDKFQYVDTSHLPEVFTKIGTV